MKGDGFMLSKPEYGWSKFSLGKGTWDLSYLTNVPLDWLDNAIWGMKNFEPFTVKAECEPGDLLCTVDHAYCYIIFQDWDEKAQEKISFEWYPLTMLEFCQQLVQDISTHLDDWSRYPCGCDLREPEEEKAAAWEKKQLEKKLKQLKRLIRIRKKYTNPAILGRNQ